MATSKPISRVLRRTEVIRAMAMAKAATKTNRHHDQNHEVLLEFQKIEKPSILHEPWNDTPILAQGGAGVHAGIGQRLRVGCNLGDKLEIKPVNNARLVVHFLHEPKRTEQGIQVKALPRDLEDAADPNLTRRQQFIVLGFLQHGGRVNIDDGSPEYLKGEQVALGKGSRTGRDLEYGNAFSEVLDVLRH